MATFATTGAGQKNLPEFPLEAVLGEKVIRIMGDEQVKKAKQVLEKWRQEMMIALK